MRTIQSSSNPRIQKIKKITKNRQEKQFLIEGKKLLQEAIGAGLKLEEIFVTADVWAKEREWLEPLEQKGSALYVISPRLLKRISDVETPQGFLGVAQKPDHGSDPKLKHLALLLVSIRDPGNFGAIVRTAEACGCEWIGYSSDCVDPFLPKVVRSSMGSLFRVPLFEIKDPSSFLNFQSQHHVQTCGLVTRKGQSLFDWKPEPPLIVCIGSESHGLPQDLPLTTRLSVPMKGKVESLNAAVAAAICLYSISFRAERNV